MTNYKNSSQDDLDKRLKEKAREVENFDLPDQKKLDLIAILREAARVIREVK